MSDPVTNAEVEDVLSSIRRLVSEDKRPIQAPSPPKTDRLVLTPALRVTDEADETKEDSSATKSDMDEKADKTDDLFLSSLVTDDEPLDVYGDKQSAGRETSALLPQDDDIPDVEDIDADAYDDDHLFDDPAHDYSNDPYNFDDETDDDGEGDDGHLNRFTADVRRAPDDAADSARAEPLRDLSQTSILTQREDLPKEQAPETSSDDAADGDMETPSPEAEENQDKAEDHTKTIAMTAKLAALESAIGRISDTWEPEEAGDSEFAGTEPEAMEWEDDLPDPAAIARMSKPASAERIEPETEERPDAKAAPVQEPASEHHQQSEQTEPKPEPKERAGFDYADDEQLIDEDALRDLVADIVRAELQGALGERITRNVRKLVRREIHRALTAQELE